MLFCCSLHISEVHSVKLRMGAMSQLQSSSPQLVGLPGHLMSDFKVVYYLPINLSSLLLVELCFEVWMGASTNVGLPSAVRRR